MKFKDLLLGTAAFTFAASTAFFACVLKKGHDFEESMDKTGNALDQCVICGGKNKIVGDVPMQDMKIGVFCGGMSVDLSQVKADKKQYDLDIEVRNGGVNVIIPENFKLNVTDRCRMGGICDDTRHPEGDGMVVLTVYADVCGGALHFENPISISEAIEPDDERLTACPCTPLA